MKGSIINRPIGSDRYSIILEVKDPITGKRKRRWHSFQGTKRQANVECARLITELKNGTAIEPNKMTVALFFEKWLEHIKTQVAPRTAERYAEIAQKNIVPVLGTVILTKLAPVTISTAYSTLLSSGRRKSAGGLSPRTVHHCHRVLKQALLQAVKWQILARNPADAVDPPKVERAQMTTYDLSQTGSLIEALRGTEVFLPTVLAVLLGLRRGEVAALRWRNVDLDRGQVAIVESAEQTKAGIRLKPPKSGRARTVALAPTIVQELRAHRLEQAQDLLKLGMGLSADTFVCTRPDGEMMEPVWITQEWIRRIKGTGLPAYRFHDLRHAHATHLLASGAHPKVASERLGHSSVGITLDLYSHVLPGMQEGAANAADEALRRAMVRKPEV